MAHVKCLVGISSTVYLGPRRLSNHKLLIYNAYMSLDDCLVEVSGDLCVILIQSKRRTIKSTINRPLTPTQINGQRDVVELDMSNRTQQKISNLAGWLLQDLGSFEGFARGSAQRLYVRRAESRVESRVEPRAEPCVKQGL